MPAANLEPGRDFNLGYSIDRVVAPYTDCKPVRPPRSFDKSGRAARKRPVRDGGHSGATQDGFDVVFRRVSKERGRPGSDRQSECESRTRPGPLLPAVLAGTGFGENDGRSFTD